MIFMKLNYKSHIVPSILVIMQVPSGLTKLLIVVIGLLKFTQYRRIDVFKRALNCTCYGKVNGAR